MVISFNILSYIDSDLAIFDSELNEFIIRDTSRQQFAEDVEVTNDSLTSDFNVKNLLTWLLEVNFRKLKDKSIESISRDRQIVLEVTPSLCMVDINIGQSPLHLSAFIGSITTVESIILFANTC